MKFAVVTACSVGLLTLLCGCSAPRSLYPIGIFEVPADELHSVREAGFNFVVGPADKAYLDKARAVGMAVYATVGTNWTCEPAFSPAVSRILRRLDHHPALQAWYLVDEPDLNLISPEEVARLNRAVKAAGTQKPTALCLYQGYQALQYGNLTDILFVDRYPVPWLPLSNFGQHVGMARLGIGKGKPLIAVIQAFDWSWYPELLPGEQNLRPPTYDEIRCMTYEALARGANGIAFYEYEGRWKMREHPVVWKSLRSVVGEVAQRTPLFLAEPEWWPKDHDFENREHRFNSALESSVTSTLLRVRYGNALVPRGRYVLAVNNTPLEITYGFSLPPRTAERQADSSPAPTEVSVLGEDRTLSPKQGWVWDHFGPLAVHVYGPL